MSTRFLGLPDRAPYTGPSVSSGQVLTAPFRYLARYGAAPTAGPLGNLHITPAIYRGLQTQTLYPTPITLPRTTLTGRQPGTVITGGVPTQTKPFGVPAFRRGNLKPYGGPAPMPLMLGSDRQLGRDTIRRPVYPPPQGLIPAVMAKLFVRGGS